MKMKCFIDGCKRKVVAVCLHRSGYCSRHLAWAKKRGCTCTFKPVRGG